MPLPAFVWLNVKRVGEPCKKSEVVFGLVAGITEYGLPPLFQYTHNVFAKFEPSGAFTSK